LHVLGIFFGCCFRGFALTLSSVFPNRVQFDYVIVVDRVVVFIVDCVVVDCVVVECVVVVDCVVVVVVEK